METRINPHDIIVASSTIPKPGEPGVPDGEYHLKVVLDGSVPQEVYSFVWATGPEGVEPEVWQIHWRGSARSCLSNFIDVAEDLMSEALGRPGSKG